MSPKYWLACGPLPAWEEAVLVGRWGFPGHCKRALQIEPGDLVFMYVTGDLTDRTGQSKRHCATVCGLLEVTQRPRYVVREAQYWPGYPYEIMIRPRYVLGHDSLVDIRPLVQVLDVFPNKTYWYLRPRMSLLLLSDRDGSLLLDRVMEATRRKTGRDDRRALAP